MENSLVSVIIPTYNRANLVTRAIASVREQLYSNIEIIIVDDGSTDNTKRVINDIDSSDAIIKYVYQTNKGVSVARNKGIEISSGKYVAFLDSDDTWHKEKISIQVEFMEENPEFSMVLCEIFSVKDDSIINSSNQTDFFQKDGDNFLNVIKNLYGISGIGSSLLAKRNALTAVGGFDPNLTTAEDRDLALRLSAKYKVGSIKKHLVYVLKQPNSLSKEVSTGNTIAALEKIEEYAPVLHKKYKTEIEKTKYIKLIEYTKDLLWEGNYEEARKMLRDAIKLNKGFPALYLRLKISIYQYMNR